MLLRLLKIYFQIVFLFLISCGKKSEIINLGKTKESELITIKGLPQNSLNKNNNIKLLVYKKELTSYQIEKDTVVAKFRPPTKIERSIQYWRQKWKYQKTTELKNNNVEYTHNLNLYQFINRIEKKTIIFDLNNGLVDRVIEYENQ